jgi:hypothetical protein
MSVMLDGKLIFVLNLIGFNWPQADEDKLKESARHWREYASELERVIADTNRILLQVRADNSGQSIDALEKHWREVGEHLRQAHDAARVVAEGLDEFAVAVEGLKVAVAIQLGILAGELAATTGAAFLTFGAAEAAAPLEIVATNIAVRKLTGMAIREAERVVVKKISKAVTEHFLTIKNGLKALKAAPTALKDFSKGFVKRGAKDLDHTGADGQTAALIPWREWPEHDGFFGGHSRPYVLKPASRIDRFGRADGRFASPQGTPFKARGLPSSRKGDSYIAYEIVRRLPVRKGLIAPWKDSAGFGIQYHLPAGAQDLVEAGYLKVIARKP